MKLYYWEGSNGKRNFGDELNTFIWPKLIPEILDNDQSRLFVGIGTLLNRNLPPAPQKFILGTGVGYGELPGERNNWTVYSVRGPLSAKKLGLDERSAVIDPGVLIKRFIPVNKNRKKYPFAYMPHWLNASNLWKGICENQGWIYIDPCWPVDHVLDTITQTECLVTEAMHGAIVADALRVPWIPVADKRNPHSLHFKWEDWCRSIQLDYKPIQVPNLREMITLFSGNDFLTSIVDTRNGVLSNEQLLEGRIAQLETIIYKFKIDHI